MSPEFRTWFPSMRQCIVPCLVITLVASGEVKGDKPVEDIKPVALLPSDMVMRFDATGTYTYDVCQTKKWRQEASDVGRWCIAEHPYYEYGGVVVVSDMDRYATWEGFILGRGVTQYFIVDTSKSWNIKGCVKFFSCEEDWKAALLRLGVPVDLRLLDPDEIASGYSPRELCPWKYRMLKGFGGLSDGKWVDMAVRATWIVSLLVGIFLRSKYWIWLLVLLGIVVGYVGDIIVFEGPAIGWIGVPITCVILRYLGRFIRRMVVKVVGKFRGVPTKNTIRP